jgi:hypothetical protein
VLYARALRAAAEKHRTPSLLRMVLFAVYAIHQLKRFDLPAERWLALDAKGRHSLADRELVLSELTAQVRARDAREAERMALAYLALGGSALGLQKTLTKLVLGNHFARPEVSGQALQLVASACELASCLPDADRTWPLRAIIRVLASPLQEHCLEAVLHRAQRGIEAPRSELQR